MRTAPRGFEPSTVNERPRPQESDLQIIPDDDGKPEQELPDVRDLLLGGSALIRLDRRQQDRIGRLEGDLLDGDELVHAGLRVVAGGPVHHDQVLAAVTRGGLDRPSHRGATPRDQEHVPRGGAQLDQVVRVHAGVPLADVLEERLGNLEFALFRCYLAHADSPTLEGSGLGAESAAEPAGHS